MALRAFLVLLGALVIIAPRPAATGTEELEWGEWSTGVFAWAKAENRFVLLDLGAVWCHWCHVMEETTYRDPAVVRLIRSRYLPVRVDQDANPELSNRYEDYGWPATIVFAPDGTELAKRVAATSRPSNSLHCSKPSSTIPSRDRPSCPRHRSCPLPRRRWIPHRKRHCWPNISRCTTTSTADGERCTSSWMRTASSMPCAVP
jgi:hypothetical protein